MCLEAASFDTIFFFDSGLKYDLEEAKQFIGAIEDHDLIIGYKSKRYDQRYRQLLTKGYNAVIKIIFPRVTINDCDSGFRMFRGKVKEIYLSGDCFFSGLSGSEITVRAIYSGLKCCEIPIKYYQRAGVSRGLPPLDIPKVVFVQFAT